MPAGSLYGVYWIVHIHMILNLCEAELRFEETMQIFPQSTLVLNVL